MRTPTLIETGLVAAIAAAVVFLVAPDFIRASDATKIELAARAAAVCDAEIVRLGASGGAISLGAIEQSLSSRAAPPLVWPKSADLSTLEFSPTGGVSVAVSLFGGKTRRVSAKDASSIGSDSGS
jgi:type II secretory pathway pseudopilin PulG